MKINDIVLCYNDFGKITEINEDKCEICFPSSFTKSRYKIKNVTKVNEKIIKYIEDLYNINNCQNLTTDKDLTRLKDLEIEKIYVKEKSLDVLYYLDNKMQNFYINIDNKQLTIYSRFKRVDKYSLTIIDYLFHFFKVLKEYNPKLNVNNKKLNDLTNDFMNNFFNPDLFYELCDEIKEKSLQELLEYCKFINDSFKNREETIFLYSIISNCAQRPYDIFVFLLNTISILKIPFFNTLAYKESEFNKVYSFLEQKDIKGFSNYIQNHYLNYQDIIYKIMQYFVKHSSNILEFINFDSNNKPHLSSDYARFLFDNTSQKNKITLIEKRCVYQLDEDVFELFDFSLLLENYNVLSSNAKSKFVKTYFDDIVKIDPKLIFNILFTKFYLNSDDQKIIIKAVNLLEDNDYLKEFLKHSISNGYVNTFKRY